MVFLACHRRSRHMLPCCPPTHRALEQAVMAQRLQELQQQRAALQAMYDMRYGPAGGQQQQEESGQEEEQRQQQGGRPAKKRKVVPITPADDMELLGGSAGPSRWGRGAAMWHWPLCCGSLHVHTARHVRRRHTSRYAPGLAQTGHAHSQSACMPCHALTHGTLQHSCHTCRTWH